MKTIVIDDEPLARKRITSLLESVKEINVVKECSNGRSAILNINSLEPDLIFLDINMKDLSGFDVLKKIEMDRKPIVIFVTAYDKHALRAFDFQAFDFLLKPFKDDRFYETIDRILNLPQREIDILFEKRLRSFLKKPEKSKEGKIPSHIPIRQGNKTILLKSSKIMYIIASGYYADIFTKDKKHVVRESLTNLKETLNEEDFFRVHRSAIINFNYVDEIVHSDYSEIDVKMKDGKLISISKSQKKKFLLTLGLNNSKGE